LKPSRIWQYRKLLRFISCTEIRKGCNALKSISGRKAAFGWRRGSLARGSDAGIKHQTQGWARTSQVAMPAKIMPGRKAGEDHARSQCPLRGEDLQCQSPSVASLCFAKASLAFGEASSGCAG